MKKASIGLFIILLFSFLVYPTAFAKNSPELRVDAVVGIDGKVKYGKGAPVTITIENSGSHFSGDFVIDTIETHRSGVGRAFPLEIGPGETKVISFDLTTYSDQQMYGSGGSNKSFHFYEGGWKKGKSISYSGHSQLRSSMYYDDYYFIASFSNEMDRLGALRGVRIRSNHNPSGNYNLQILNATKIDHSFLPNESYGWGATDSIVIDEYPIADLSKEKQEALLEWVRTGGVLVIGASDNLVAESGIFSDFLPMELKGRTETAEEVFNEWIKSEGFHDAIPTYDTELTPEATSIFQNEGHHLAAQRKIGNGIIIQTAFSVGDDPIATSNGMTALWNVLIESSNQSLNPMQMYRQNPMEGISSVVGGTNELFPSFKVSAPIIFGIILLYIILVVPVLYFILKRKDKREYAWWIIPAVSILVSIGILGYGAKDRIGRAQVQHTAILNVDESGKLRGYYTEAILSNKAGDFTFTAPKGTTLSASLPDNLFGPNINQVHNRAMIEQDFSGSKLHLMKLGYWTVASVYGESKIEDLGQYIIDLTIENKELSGSITNDFPFALKDVSIWSGSSLIPLGELNPGETITIEHKLSTSTLLSRSSIFSQSVFGMRNNNIMKMRQDAALSFSSDIFNTDQKPVIIGFTDHQVVPVGLDKIKPSVSSLTLIVQPIEPKMSLDGPITLNSELMHMSMQSEKGLEPGHSGEPAHPYFFDAEIYMQTWQVSEEFSKLGLAWTELKLTNPEVGLYNLSILNLQSGQFEELTSDELIIHDQIGEYVNAENEILIKLQFHQWTNGNVAKAPELSLTGEVAQ